MTEKTPQPIGWGVCLLDLTADLPVGGQDDLLGILGLFLGGRFHAFQGIGDTQLLVFADAHDVVGQDVQGLYVGQGTQESAQLGQLARIVGDARNHHMADPNGDVFLSQILGESQDPGVVMAGEAFMGLGIHVLDVQHHQVCDCHQSIQLLVVRGGTGAVSDTGGIQTGVDSLCLGQGEQLQNKVDLHQGFAAGDGDAALAVESFITVVFLKNRLGRADRAGIHFPGVGVMAVLAPHGAALKKHHEPDAGAVHRAEAFCGMDKAIHKLRSSRGRYGR